MRTSKDRRIDRADQVRQALATASEDRNVRCERTSSIGFDLQGMDCDRLTEVSEPRVVCGIIARAY